MRNIETIKRDILIAISTLVTFLVLYIFRSADDNTVTSWQWMVCGSNVTRIYLFLIAGVIIAYPVSRLPWSGRTCLLLVFFFSFGIGAIFWSIPNFILDSSRYFAQAKYLELYGIKYFLREWGHEIPAWTDLPAVPFIFGLIFKVFGESRLVIQIFMTLLFSLTIIVTVLIGKRLWDEDIGFEAGALLLGIPYLFTQVPLMLVDIPAACFLMLSIYGLMKVLEEGGIQRILVTSVAVFFTFFSKYSTWPMLSVLLFTVAAYFYSSPRLSSRNVFARASSVIILSCLLIGTAIILKYDVIADQVRLLINFQAPGLKRWEEGFVSTFFFQIHPLITIAALYSIFAAFQKKDIRYLMIFWLPFLAVAFQIKRARYLVPLLPSLALMASYGLQKIRDRDAKKFIISCAVASSLVIAIVAYRPFLKNLGTVNVKDAGTFLDSIDADAVEIETLVQKDEVANPAVLVPLLDLHTKKRILYHYQPENFPSAREIATSKLRFTWEYKNPRYYDGPIDPDHKNRALVIISRDLEPLPPDIAEKTRSYRNSRIFNKHDGVYYYKIAIRVFW